MDHELIYEPFDAYTSEEFSAWLDELEARQEQDADEFPNFVNRQFDEAAAEGYYRVIRQNGVIWG